MSTPHVGSLLKITGGDLSRYRSQSWPHITSIIWVAGMLNGSVLKNFGNVVKLDCSNNRLTSLQGIQWLTRLRELDCSVNCLTSLSEASNCSNLQRLICDHNRLESIQIIECFPALTYLNCRNNPLHSVVVEGAGSNLTKIDFQHCGLESIEGIGTYSNLEAIWCNGNRLTTLKGIEACSRLREFYGHSNRLVTLDWLSACPLLTAIVCQHNKLTSLAEISGLSNLNRLCCQSNEIVSLDPVVYLRHLTHFTYNDNPLEIQSERFQRYIHRYEALNARSGTNGTVYDDSQNVHNIHIQQSVRKSLISLLTDSKPTFSPSDLLVMIANTDMDDCVKQLLIEYCSNSYVHSDHMISYSELLGYVWNRITRSEHTIELFKILSQQISDSRGKCFTGRFNRLVSVLVGFYPDIVIEISDTARISAIILAIQKRINPYDLTTHAETATIELQEAGYSLDEIKPWIDAIMDTASDL